MAREKKSDGKVLRGLCLSVFLIRFYCSCRAEKVDAVNFIDF